MTKDSGNGSTPTRGSIHRAKATRAPPEMLERLKNWHVFSMSGSRQPTKASPTNSESESETTSPPDSEIPEPGKPSSASPEDSVEKED